MIENNGNFPFCSYFNEIRVESTSKGKSIEPQSMEDTSTALTKKYGYTTRDFITLALLEAKKADEAKDEYIPSTAQEQSGTYTKQTVSNNSHVAQTIDKWASIMFPSDVNSNEFRASHVLYWKRAIIQNDLSACDLESPDYYTRHVEIGDKIDNDEKLQIRKVNREPKIYSLDEIYQTDNPDINIMYKVISSPEKTQVPEEVKKLGDWYVEHWNEISLSYASSEGKIVSSEDEDLTREEQMKLYALKSAALFQQLHANEEAGLKKEDYYIRDFWEIKSGRINNSVQGREIPSLDPVIEQLRYSDFMNMCSEILNTYS
jgi:hypothetical protein